MQGCLHRPFLQSPRRTLQQVAQRIGVMSNTTKPFDYAAFVDELRVLRDSYADPPPNHRNAESLAFKQWRHQLSDLIGRIEAKGYHINCRVNERRFRETASWSQPARDRKSAFDTAHAETMIELDAIISNFQKYGDPKEPPQVPLLASLHADPAPRERLEWNKEATFSWYLQNTPVGTIWAFMGIVATLMYGSYRVGVTVERWWPEVKPSAATDHELKTVPKVQSPSVSAPAAAPSAQRPLPSDQRTSDPQVQPRQQ